MRGNKHNKVILGGITKKTSCNNYTGFTIAFEDPKLAQHYKQMFYYILRSDKLNIDVKTGYNDEKENKYW